MDITPLIEESMPYVKGLGPGYFYVGERRIEHSLFLMGKESSKLDAQTIEDLTPSHFKNLEEVEFILIGTGTHYKRLPEELLRFFTEKKLAFEIMDTAAACRTYAILIAEGRKIASFLIRLEASTTKL